MGAHGRRCERDGVRRRTLVWLAVAVAVLTLASVGLAHATAPRPVQHHSVVTDYNDGFVDGESQCGMGPRG